MVTCAFCSQANKQISWDLRSARSFLASSERNRFFQTDVAASGTVKINFRFKDQESPGVNTFYICECSVGGNKTQDMTPSPQFLENRHVEPHYGQRPQQSHLIEACLGETVERVVTYSLLDFLDEYGALLTGGPYFNLNSLVLEDDGDTGGREDGGGGGGWGNGSRDDNNSLPSDHLKADLPSERTSAVATTVGGGGAPAPSEASEAAISSAAAASPASPAPAPPAAATSPKLKTKTAKPVKPKSQELSKIASDLFSLLVQDQIDNIVEGTKPERIVEECFDLACELDHIDFNNPEKDDNLHQALEEKIDQMNQEEKEEDLLKYYSLLTRFIGKYKEFIKFSQSDSKWKIKFEEYNRI